MFGLACGVEMLGFSVMVLLFGFDCLLLELCLWLLFCFDSFRFYDLVWLRFGIVLMI